MSRILIPGVEVGEEEDPAPKQEEDQEEEEEEEEEIDDQEEELPEMYIPRLLDAAGKIIHLLIHILIYFFI